MKCPVLVNLPQSPRLWESGNPAGFAGFRLFHSPVAPAIFSAACPSRDLFRLRSRNDSLYFDCPLHRGLPLRQHTGPCSPTFTRRKADISCPISTGHFMDQRHWRCPWLAPGAHLAIVLPPRVIRFGSGRLLSLGRGLPGSYCLNWNRAWNLLPNHRPTAIANLSARPPIRTP